MLGVLDRSMAINEMIAILTFLFLGVQESFGFVGYLAQGTGLNTGATRASDELRDRRSWTNPAASRAVRNKFSGAERWPDRILRNIHGPFHAISNPDSASRPQQPSFGYFHEVESAKISVGQVAGSASAARASSRVYGTELCAVAGGSGGAELTSDAPPSKPKRRGRPRKTAVDTDEQKTKAIATAKRMAAGVASTAPAREERAMTVVAESATLENNVGGISQTGAVMMEETGVVDVLGEGIAEPLVGSTAGSISIIGGDILGGDEVSALLTEEGDQSEWGVGDEEKPTVKARKGRPRGSRGKAKTNGSINGDKELSPDAIDQEEARQDKQAAHIQVHVDETPRSLIFKITPVVGFRAPWTI